MSHILYSYRESKRLKGSFAMPETGNAQQSDGNGLLIVGYREVKPTGNSNRPPYTKPLHRSLHGQADPNHPKNEGEFVVNQAWATYLAAQSFPI